MNTFLYLKTMKQSRHVGTILLLDKLKPMEYKKKGYV